MARELLNKQLRLMLLPMRLCLSCRPLLVAIAALAAAAAGGCDRRSEGVMQIVVIGGEPRLADPRQGPLTAAERVLINNAAQGLVRFDASGQVEPGLAETWNVSDDGLSYIFRLASAQWPDGRRVTAEQVARMIRNLVGPSSRSPLKESLAAIEDVVAMTDRVLEIRLSQPRPHLLQLLAQPEMGLVRDRRGSGPFAVAAEPGGQGKLRLSREIEVADGDEPLPEQLDLGAASAEEAVKAFAERRTDLVLGGTFATLPLAQAARLPRAALRFDPASGLFGLMPARARGLLADAEVRELLSSAIDRDALVAQLAVPGLVPRATVLEPGLADASDPVQPEWMAEPRAERLPRLLAAARQLIPADEQAAIGVALPEGPGSEILLRRLQLDWGPLGIEVRRATGTGDTDLRLVDAVAPSASAAWFLRQFHCDAARICDDEVDELLDGARNTPVLEQRAALLDEARARIDGLQLFIPIAAPIRWSLVSSRVSGFAGNRFAIHTLTGLEQRLNRTQE